MKQKYVIIILLSLITGGVFAQNETDAFRYAQYAPTGSARYMGTGGSMGAFGADFSVLSTSNPAGIGLYKRSEITFTPTLSYNKTTTTYNGTTMDEGKYKFNLNNLGFVVAIPLSSSSKWKNFQLATGYTNLARYNSSYYVEGSNTAYGKGNTSFFDHIASYATNNEYIDMDNIFISGSKPDFSQYSMNDYIASLGWYYWFIDAAQGTTDQFISLVDGNFTQQQSVSTKGYLNEWVFSGGANYDDKLFIGATLGIPFFNYTYKSSYTESKNDYYDELTYYDEFQSRGTGINLKLGLLYQPAKFIRFGAAFHTPTLFNNVKESFYTYFDVYNREIDTTRHIPSTLEVEGNVDYYQLITPYHVTGNVAFLINRYGFVNIDYEYVDYASSQVETHSRDNYAVAEFKRINQSVKKYYKGTHSVRVGGELNLSPVAFRLGYSFTSNPYAKELDKNGTTHTISAGIGYKTRYFFMDFAYRYYFYKNNAVFYDASNINPYDMKYANQLFALTFGWKFGK